VKRPHGAYSRSKAESEQVARRYQEQGAPVVITYPGGVIGPHDPYLGESNRTMAEFATSGMTMRGGGMWVDVRDVAKVHAAVMEPGRGPRRYMITGHYIALPDLTAALREIAAHPGRIVVLPASAAQAIGRMADLVQHIVPGRVPLGYEGMWIAALQPHCDDSRTVTELGITTRPARDPRRHSAVAGRRRPHLPRPGAGSSLRGEAKARTRRRQPCPRPIPRNEDT
jgi:UDP-glucose 4-epimerase